MIRLQALQLYQKQTPTQLFSCKYCETFKNSFFIEYVRWLLLKGDGIWLISDLCFHFISPANTRKPKVFGGYVIGTQVLNELKSIFLNLGNKTILIIIKKNSQTVKYLIVELFCKTRTEVYSCSSQMSDRILNTTLQFLYLHC